MSQIEKSKLDQALELRQQALELLKQAQELDGLKPYFIRHEFNNGTSDYIVYADRLPEDQVLAKCLGMDFEPDREEYITGSSDDFSLQEMVGVKPDRRIFADEAEHEFGDREAALRVAHADTPR